MHFFWHRGYHAASMRDIVAYTGVAHAGLYSAFGGKEQLFQAALQRYFDTVLAGLLTELEEPAASRAAVERFFTELLSAVQAGHWLDGCFMCNTATEFGDQPGVIQQAVNSRLNHMQHLFQQALQRAQRTGEVRNSLDVNATAALLVTLFVGSAILVRAHVPLAPLAQGVQAALQGFD